MQIGDFFITWQPRETGPDDGDPWRPVMLTYADRPQSGQSYIPDDSMLGAGGANGDDPYVVLASGADANGFPETLEVEWETRDGLARQTYRPSGESRG